MAVEYLGLHAIGWHEMTNNWWERVLAAILLSAVVLGTLFVTTVIFSSIRKSLRKKHEHISKLPKPVAERIEELKSTSQPLRLPQKDGFQVAPKSFGAYLGSFANPATPAQARLLSQWETVILDPLQTGVLDAVTSFTTSPRVLGRLDVADSVRYPSSSSNDEMVRSLDIVAQTLSTQFKRPQDTQSPFTGVLLANWQAHFQPVVFNQFVKFVKGLNLAVYLEVSPPAYLSVSECAEIDFELISGMAFRNGTILANGDFCNYFQMQDMLRAFRALAKQMSLYNNTVMMWETVDSDAELTHAVVKRSFNWCRYNSAISWIGPKAALYHAEIAARETITGEPLGALMWLKSDEVMKAHDIWRLNDRIVKGSCSHQAAYDSLQPVIPDLAARLSLLPTTIAEPQSEGQATALIGDFPLPPQNHDAQANPFSFSARGDDYTGLGCFQIGLECSRKEFTDLVEGQRRLRDLNLLDRVKPEKIRIIGEKLQALYEARSSWARTENDSVTLKELLELVNNHNGDSKDCLRVYSALNSGFHSNLKNQWWGLYEVDLSCTDIYLTRKVEDIAGAVLHTFMCSRGYTRAQCFMWEILLSEHTGLASERWNLPNRIVQDITQLTPSEAILFLQRIVTSKCEDPLNFLTKVRTCLEYQLIDVPTVAQLKDLNTAAYLRREISPEDLVASRLAWHREQGCAHLDLVSAISVFREIDTRLADFLRNQQADVLSRLEAVLTTILQKNQIDASADILALSVFCAFRKSAIDEVYLEVLDRNPLPNNAHSDQAACFAEMFGTGSQCQSYFDMTSNVLGKLLFDRYRAYYHEHPPPVRDDHSTELPTTYVSKNVDLDPEAKPLELPFHYRITFLGIFAVPALIDIMLLTTIGRGLYLSTYMEAEVKTMATAALMVSLLICGAIGTWIASGGSYYLHSMAFPAMNMFVLTRFVAGVSIVLSGGLLAFIMIGVTNSFYAGIIFFLYFIFLSTYLTLLATLAIYQLPGFMFQSGRTTVMACIPILLISPIITLWIHHDIVVYLCVLAGFLVILILRARSTISQWSSWFLKIPIVSDTEVVNWYVKKAEAEGITLPEGVADLGPTPLPRTALLNAVLKEVNRHPWTKPTPDEFVKKLAGGYSATMFLMDWYTKYSRTKMPYRYSPTWNLQAKTAIDTLKDMQKGLKLHNAFLHWRHAGDEVWCGILYFVIALMDKWVALISGGSLVGLSDADSQIFRLAVGFGLAYYLIAAVCLDGVAQPLWMMANKKTAQPITSLAYLKQVAINDAIARRHLYWSSFVKFFFTHIWGLAVSASLMWSFEESRDATIMYVAYCGAYTGLLWYQYNRIYCGPRALKNLLTAAVVGLVTGPVLHRAVPHFEYSSVIALAAGTWAAAITSLFTANIGWPSSKIDQKPLDIEMPPIFSYSSSSGADFSQRALSETWGSVCELPAEDRFTLNPSTHPGAEVMEALLSQVNANKPHLLRAAFRSSDQLLYRTEELWRNGEIVVELVPARHLLLSEHKMRAISRTADGRTHIMVFSGLHSTGRTLADIRRNCKVVAEAIIQATAQSKFGLSHDQAALAELLAVDHEYDEQLSIPEGVKRQLEISATERSRVIDNGDKETLRYLLLGLNCDTEWDNLPRNVRLFLLKRCSGKACDITEDQASWIRSRFLKDKSTDAEEYIERCNLGVSLSTLVVSYAKSVAADYTYQGFPDALNSSYESYEQLFGRPLPMNTSGYKRKPIEAAKRAALRVLYATRFAIKFIVVSLVADPEFQRELDYVIKDKVFLIRWPVTFVLNGIWVYCKTLQNFILPAFLFHRRETLPALVGNMKGIKTVMMKNRVVVESVNGPSTCFFKTRPDGNIHLLQYSGRHKQEPEGVKQLMAVNTYNDKLVLTQHEEYAKETVANVYVYEYPAGQTLGSKLPISRECIKGGRNRELVQYNEKGYITSGSYIKDDSPVRFTFEYRKNAKFDDELLRAEFILPHIRRKCYERLDRYVPYTKVTEATFTQGSDTYHSTWDYDHRWHPTITTTLNGQLVPTPPMIDFLSDNLLFSFKSIKTNIFSRFLGLNTKWYPILTGRARTQLWKAWKSGKDVDAVTARWMDENALRKERVLRPYWAARDMGRLRAAGEYIRAYEDVIMARIDIDPEVSSWTPLAFKLPDLSAFGQGGDSTINTRTAATQLRDAKDELHVLAMDTGTWPNEGGTIRWHVLAENANDFGVPKFQIERNVQSVTVLPLWGLDFLTPTHGVFENHLDSEIQRRSLDAMTPDIKRNFIPILSTLVRCSRALKLDHNHLGEAGRALVDLNAYFASTGHWNEVWNSEIVKETWRELWLNEDMENTLPVSQWLKAECPTLLHLDNALDMWHRYLFIFSVPVPEKIPDVFQASHHFAGASYGVLCKLIRNCTLHVWDHCISWREVTVFLSSAMSFDAPFVCSSLISLSRLASVLILHHADVVLPCADFFNPAWEIELGTQENTLGHRREYARKIDPVVNGICNMEKFQPIKEIKSKKPTVVMLSHVRFVKDIKNALLAADIIVNEWGITDYQLDIYGDMEKAPAYSVECKEILASKGLRDYVALRGLGSPSKVLEEGWLFLNSSISEGLPLAMGEAALTGVPVVCTDVGASFRVVTDPVTWKKFSAVVAPNDPYSLARAQITVMGLLDEWSEFSDDASLKPRLPLKPTKEEAKQITQRLYEKADLRRKLGMMGRDNVLNSFSADRYLREHEQMLWIGKHQNVSRFSHLSWPASTESSSGSSTARTDDFRNSLRNPFASRAASTVYSNYPSSDIEMVEPLPPMPMSYQSSSALQEKFVQPQTTQMQAPTQSQMVEMEAGVGRRPSKLQERFEQTVGLGRRLSLRPVYRRVDTSSPLPSPGLDPLPPSGSRSRR
ncbi:hypothetical protein H2203_005287 [Taxawa tesnikishii (nom. ined.)]|nr:hypothetical protein H2203_005287 [Dothideales sp. JES 119]